MSAGSHTASLIERLDFKTAQGLRLRPDVFGPQALENVTALYLEDRLDLPQFEQDVEAILRVWGGDDPLDAL